MRLPGYCTECRRPRQVRVSSHGMAMLAATDVAEGVCDDCEQRGNAKLWLRGRRGAREVLAALAASRTPLMANEIELSRVDSQHIPSILRAHAGKRLAAQTRGAFTITQLGLDVLR